MPIPGLTGGGRLPMVVVTAGAGGFDVAAALGNPSGAVRYNLVIPAGVAAGGSPGIDAETGMHVDSVGYWINLGIVGGDGGAGGAGGTAGGAGAGGGAGHTKGAGGAGGGAGTSGADGEDVSAGAAPYTGGAGGVTDFPTLSVSGAGNGADGADAIALNHAITLVNASGEIIGGGGGGAGGWHNLFFGRHGGAGGDAAADGALGTEIGSVVGEVTSVGVAGFAIRYSGNGSATFLSGDSSPNVEGTVG